MRGIADKRNALGNERTRNEESERMNTPRADRFDVAEMQLETPLKLGMEIVIRQRHDALRFALRLGPDDRGATAFQWQDRKWPGGQEMFFGAPVVIALVADIGHDGGLRIAPAMRGDAGALANGRARAIGGDQQSCR